MTLWRSRSAFATVGLVLALRRPAIPIGWLYGAAGLASSWTTPAGPWVEQLVRDGRRPRRVARQTGDPRPVGDLVKVKLDEFGRRGVQGRQRAYASSPMDPARSAEGPFPLGGLVQGRSGSVGSAVRPPAGSELIARRQSSVDSPRTRCYDRCLTAAFVGFHVQAKGLHVVVRRSILVSAAVGSYQGHVVIAASNNATASGSESST